MANSNSNCPLDQHFLKFAGVDAKALSKQLAAGKGDGEILQWIQKNAKHKHSEIEIHAWSCFQNNRGTSDLESRQDLQ